MYKSTTQAVIDKIRSITADIDDGFLADRETAIAEFKRRVSKQELENCLTDTDLDSGDALAIKNLLGLFFNQKEVLS